MEKYKKYRHKNMTWYFRSFINVYKGPNMQTMDEKAELVQKLLSWLFGEIQQEREWQNTPDANLQEVQDRFQFMTRVILARSYI